ncbi:acyltransferase family protein [Guptibacillus hwajinpoensis]|uniref:Membrane-bound acyltransferase YfiQ involved in biofilm formation n=1 Tax=Guptibacillus hwajinpoensis TaxID=208199 RepID=A0ABU0JZR8_9BACL|nr:acyltransferase family protein [Alkalihalobacillus hemicentroti]MDQ0482534.1 membrane-bound acyltransferase YfiQ involved in biofilm formation [Alkalihalobacillus hemicentroti]
MTWMEQRKTIDEVFLLRSMACLGIVFLHSFARSFLETNVIVNSMNLLFTFATPTFVFISIFILARSYKDQLPTNFWGKRVKFVLFPYLLFGTFYAGSKGLEVALSSDTSVMGAFWYFLWRHILLGDYHGYFILIILQFYVLYYFFHSHLKKWNPKVVLPVAFLITSAYLGFFNFVPPIQTPVGEYIWAKLYWIPFFGWLFYFTLAYYCGRYYPEFVALLQKHSKFVLAGPVVTGSLCVYLFQIDVFGKISSKQIDLVFFTTSMIFFIYYVGMSIKRVPDFFVFISQYAFGIYLFHPLFMAFIYIGLSLIPLSLPALIQVAIYAVVSVILSVIATFIMNKIPLGHYVSGKIGMGRTKAPKKEVSSSVIVPQGVVNK